MTLVHKWGGVVEQPAGSRLIRDYAQPGSEIERVYQVDFGHSAIKATLLYWYIPGLDLTQPIMAGMTTYKERLFRTNVPD